MKTVTLGSTGITTPQNAFGALPVQRVSIEDGVRLLRRAFDGGMTYFDTARAYTDSEEKLGLAFGTNGLRDQLFIATKTGSKTPEEFREHLDTSLRMLKTDHIDVYQFHMADQAYAPGDGTGMYECMLEAKQAGKILHIGITAHKIGVAFDAVNSGLYETLQFPFSYLAGPREVELVNLCKEKNMGFVCMKGLSGGLITNSAAAMAFMTQFDNALPIWGIQRERELDEFLSYMDNTPEWNDEYAAFVEADRAELAGDFCRGCGYCEPCPAGIIIHQCARIGLMVRRAPSAAWLNDYWQAEMAKIPNCLHCNNCSSHCPYELDTPTLLQKNYEDYQRILAGEVTV
ncbi:MAG: aldo/keto reductase [Coriobacteriales bacterium]|nr:aldo/keto reductase [Coriobacteriales bacterium]